MGVTGSSGKTSTKDLLAAVLEPLGATVAPVGSLNTEIGVPLTALVADEGTRHLVVEMGARGVGHIAYLCEVTPPQIGVVLNVGAAHAGEFGSKEATARAKSELVAALPAAADGGVAVLNADDPLVAAMAGVTPARVVTFGLGPDAGVRAEEVRLDPLGRPSFLLRAGDLEPVEVTLPLHGAHHVGNALAAAAVALELGATPAGVAAALATAVPRSRWRMEVVERPDGVTVVNDAYNANPDSVRAALAALVAMAERPADLGRPRRDARARRGVRRRARARWADWHAGRASRACWSWVRGLTGCTAARSPRAPSTERGASSWPTCPPLSSCSPPSCVRVTSCWSRPRAAAGWSGWPRGCSDETGPARGVPRPDRRRCSARRWPSGC